MLVPLPQGPALQHTTLSPVRISRIYTDAPLQSGQQLGLDEKSSHHLSRVLRHKVQDQLVLFNGDGREYQAVISSIDKKQVVVSVGSYSAPCTESYLQIHLGIAMSKGDRMDWVLQKSTELGVTAIYPLVTERTELKLKGDRLDKKLAHWRQVIISACEQCGRNILPSLHHPVTSQQWSESIEADRKLVLHHRGAESIDSPASVGSVALLIGPEGGLSVEEIAHAQKQKFQALTLGPRVLRTETAPLAAISVLQYVWGDFK